MPQYVYKCEECAEEFTVFHSMGETLKKKDGCALSCSLHRIPQLTTKFVTSDEKKKVGEEVIQFIEETKEELKQEKENMREVNWE